MHSEDGKCRSECCCLVTKSFFATTWTVARQIPLSMGFSRQEYWGVLSFPSPVDCPNLGIKPVSPAVEGRFFFLVAKPSGKYIEVDTPHQILNVKVTQSCLTLQPHELDSPWNSPGQNTGVGSLSLL